MLNPVREIVDVAREKFAELLQRATEQAPLRIEQYQRYLSMQYHFTRGVQTHFMRVAAHSDMRHRKSLRKFLVNFANEEEQHYLVAGKDLAKLELTILPEPLDVTLWHAYFERIVDRRPFLRLGATCVLENISGGVAREHVQRALQASFLNAENTRFLVLHQHELLPHGDQILQALEQAKLEPRHVDDLVASAGIGTVMYLRMAEWALFPDCLASLVDSAAIENISESDMEDVRRFEIDEIYPSNPA